MIRSGDTIATPPNEDDLANLFAAVMVDVAPSSSETDPHTQFFPRMIMWGGTANALPPTSINFSLPARTL